MASTRLVAVIIVALGTFAPGCASTSAPIHAAAPQTNVCTAKLVEGGNLNGKTIDAAHDAITVAPGAPIKGSIAVETFNAMHENAVAPLGGTVDWGNRCEQPWLAERWIETGTHRYVVQVDKAAPSIPGTYHIIVAFRGEYNVGQVMSLTNWSAYDDQRAIWSDGNDIGFDWTPHEYRQAIEHGTVRTHMIEAGGKKGDVWQPAAVVEVRVR